MISAGQTATATVVVTESNIAKTMKSGALEVFATPAMCALMEEAAQAAVQPHLEAGEGTVGISLSITHEAPSPLGATITAKATVSAVEGRKITFDIEASDGIGIIGRGTHERFIINNDKFMAKVINRTKSN
ncbi:dihydrolipoamide acyltransferase [Veillonella denticariosi JCM 15641]|uniref:Dihydrolipoamide acyltransferase n=1 Tax=Veillonella denticariosi JCM 15641 TaxID=1298594 RepID=A0A2S7Z6N6_9FIRM|nr:thioesterase family protein [Veillonella denticariosi]PQL18944.1 dihydrolipoamide acyltransferase [Veillonella denticariosi JCM 15641]